MQEGIGKKMSKYKKTISLLVLCLCLACAPSSEELDGEWKGQGLEININVSGKSIDYKDINEPKNSFKKYIDKIERHIDEKWDVKLSDNQTLLFKVFNRTILFLYKESSYVRLKKQKKG